LPSRRGRAPRCQAALSGFLKTKRRPGLLSAAPTYPYRNLGACARAPPVFSLRDASLLVCRSFASLRPGAPGSSNPLRGESSVRIAKWRGTVKSTPIASHCWGLATYEVDGQGVASLESRDGQRRIPALLRAVAAAGPSVTSCRSGAARPRNVLRWADQPLNAYDELTPRTTSFHRAGPSSGISAPGGDLRRSRGLGQNVVWLRGGRIGRVAAVNPGSHSFRARREDLCLSVDSLRWRGPRPAAGRAFVANASRPDTAPRASSCQVLVQREPEVRLL